MTSESSNPWGIVLLEDVSFQTLYGLHRDRFLVRNSPMALFTQCSGTSDGERDTFVIRSMMPVRLVGAVEEVRLRVGCVLRLNQILRETGN